MKNGKIILVVAGLLVFISANLSAEEAININTEFLGSTSGGVGLNIEYSPNGNIDLGIGTIIYPFPIGEIHLNARCKPFNYFISPFIDLSAGWIVVNFVDASYIPLEEQIVIRLHAGINVEFKLGFYLGLSIGYQIYGDFLEELPIIPGGYLGYKIKI